MIGCSVACGTIVKIVRQRIGSITFQVINRVEASMPTSPRPPDLSLRDEPWARGETPGRFIRMRAAAATFAGNHAEVRDHANYILNHPSSTYATTRLRGLLIDQRISARTMLARTLWQQGFPDQARDRAEEGLALGLSLGHAVSVCLILAHAVATIALWRGEFARAAEATELLLTRVEREWLLHLAQLWPGLSGSAAAGNVGSRTEAPEHGRTSARGRCNCEPNIGRRGDTGA